MASCQMVLEVFNYNPEGFFLHDHSLEKIIDVRENTALPSVSKGAAFEETCYDSFSQTDTTSRGLNETSATYFSQNATKRSSSCSHVFTAPYEQLVEGSRRPKASTPTESCDNAVWETFLL